MNRSSNPFEELEKERLWRLLALFAVTGLILIIRSAWWEIFPHPKLQDYELVNLPDVIPAVRADVLDATGYHLLLSSYTCDVYVRPDQLNLEPKEAPQAGPNPEGAASMHSAPTRLPELAEMLSVILDEPAQTILQALTAEPTSRHQIAARKPISACQQLAELDIDGIEIERGYRRICPDGMLAGPTLGFINLAGEGVGLEKYYDSVLSGTPGEWRGIRDWLGRPFLSVLGGYRAPQDGATLVLTLDRNIQYQAEFLLRQAKAKHRASGGNIIVLDPATGAVLAMANDPSYDPCHYWEVEDHKNTAVTVPYEPGSVIKPLTLAAALDTHVIEPDDTYDDRGSITVGGVEIYNADRRPHGPTTMTELLAYSLNVGAAHVASELGPTRFYEYMRRFGFGEVTGIDLPAEVPGNMRVPSQDTWSMADLGRHAYGQGLSVTPVQLAAAYGALANKGIWTRPHLLAEMHRGDEVQPYQLLRRRVLAPETAQAITELMANAVELGMAKAIVPGYRVAGKSGTAQIPEPAVGYSDDVIVSFVGYGPLPNPKVVILVKLDQPQIDPWGSEAAAPVFRELFQFIMDYYGLPPQS